MSLVRQYRQSLSSGLIGKNGSESLSQGRNVWMEYFNIDQSTLIGAYGLGNNGKRKCKELLKAGYNLVGLIDREGENMPPYCGIEVYSPDSFASIFPNKEEMVIIICLTNALQHEKAVHLLSSYGFRKFLYIPMDENLDYQYLMEMQQAYSHFENGKFSELRRIPFDTRSNKEKEQNADDLIAADGESVVFLCRIEDVFTGTIQQLKATFNRQANYEKMLNDQRYLDIPLASLEPYKNLYDYLMGKGAYPNKYFEINGDDECYNQRLLKDRIELFRCYEKRYNRDIRLFYLQPAAVIWNKEKNCFNVGDGNHRLMYLYYVKNHFLVPVKASKESYEQYKKLVKKEGYIYKSAELVLQELLSPEYLSGNGAVIRQNDADVEQLFRWARCTSYSNIEELSPSKQYAWIFYKLDSKRDIFGRLAEHSSIIILECTDEELDEKAYGNYYKVINRGEVLTEALDRRIYFLLKRKSDLV